ncbi:MAG: acyl-CoA dehydrogenase family protein, partial [Candidatus Rokuibacteriota bacterium]
ECPEQLVREMEEDEKGYSPELWQKMAQQGWMGLIIPDKYDGTGMNVCELVVLLEEFGRALVPGPFISTVVLGGVPIMEAGTEEQKQQFLPKIASGELRLQAFGVTEPDAGSDTTKLKTTAVRTGDRYVVNGRKMFISRAMQSDLMLLLARTTSAEQVKRRTDGLSVFLIDIRGLKGLEIRPLRMMMNHSTNALFFDNMEIPAGSLIGQEGRGFSYILDGMNAERILVASDSLGDARWFTEKAVAYAGQRVIFGKPIGANQGVQFPIAKAHVSIEAADLMRTKAARMFDGGIPCGPEANMAKYLASEAAIEAGNACIDCHGGYGFAEEYDIERKFRESRLYRAAPINNNLVIAYVGEHVLGMPRSY